MLAIFHFASFLISLQRFCDAVTQLSYFLTLVARENHDSPKPAVSEQVEKSYKRITTQPGALSRATPGMKDSELR